MTVLANEEVAAKLGEAGAEVTVLKDKTRRVEAFTLQASLGPARAHLVRRVATYYDVSGERAGVQHQ